MPRKRLYTPEEAKRRRREKERLRQQKLREDPEFRAKDIARKKLWMQRNKKKQQTHNELCRQRRIERDREEYLRKRNEYTNANAERINRLKRAAYRKTLDYAITEFRRGNINLDELNRRIRQTLIQVNAIDETE